MGMLNNPWFRVKVHRTTAPKAEAGTLPRVRFEHPTLAGNQNGGWMMRLKEHPALIAPGAFNDHVDAPDAAAAAATVTAAPADTDAAAVPAVFDPSKPSFSLAEVEQHASAESAWMVVNDKVYDATPFLQAHWW
jgi:nitrate reductase (NAD(P)H)